MADPNVLVPLPDHGRRGARLEIDEFLMDNEMTNLFLIAFQNLHTGSLVKTDQHQPNWTNFYAIAGIHGLPNENWAGVEKDGGGYCHHEMNTFPTWHRPYMGLIELALYREMAKIAALYPNNADVKTYQDAAARFRLPYWDMVMPRNEMRGNRPDTVWGFPQIFKQASVFVKLPKPIKTTREDGWTEIVNPLFSYRFPSKQDFDSSGRPPLKQSARFNQVFTSRIPQPDMTTNNSYCDMAVQRQGVARATMLWQMLNPDITDKELTGRSTGVDIKINDFRTWEQFANRGSGNQVVVSSGQTYRMPSLESWHDGIHVLLGTGQYYDATQGAFPQGKDVPNATSARSGQMGDPSYAAFDPVFFLHHCNIDRLLALYQALFPGRYCNPEDGEMPLTPFLTGKTAPGSEFWKSNDSYVKDYWHAGYAVPGNSVPDKNTNQADVRAALKTYLTNTYYWATNNTSHKKTLPNWPKPLGGSWALFGPNAKVPEKIVIERTAMRARAHVPQIFTQEKVVPIALESAPDQVALLPEPEFHESAIEPSAVLDLADSVNTSLPAGALIDLEDPDKLTAQITWNATVKVHKYAFDGSFSVHLFTGYVKDDQTNRYMTKKNEVGFAGIFSRTADSVTACSNCAKQMENNLIVEDVVPMTTLLYDYLESDPHSADLIREGQYRTLRDLTPASVVPFLKEQLQWRIIDLSATLLSGQEQQAGLEITVSSRQYTPPTADNIMGVYGPETVYPEITSGKPGGFGYVY